MPSPSNDRARSALHATLSGLDALKTVSVQRLPLAVRWAYGESDLAAIADLRARCYGRHVPAIGSRLREPEAQDRERCTRVLLAEDRASGRAIGTLRIEHNTRRALTIEASAPLPARLAGARLVEAARLCVEAGAPVQTRLALFKALYQHCLAQHVDSIVACARGPLVRIYESLLFTDLLEGRAEVPMLHVANLPHRVLGLELTSAASAWLARRHPLCEFMVQTHHPDIRIAEPWPARGRRHRPRRLSAWACRPERRGSR